MTQHHDDAFTPDTVDERVDQLTSLAPQPSSPPSARVVQRLHALYEEDQQSTERVWERLRQHVNEHEESDVSPEYQQPGSLSGIQEGRGLMLQETLSPRKTGPTRLMLVAAVLFATVLVSSLLWVVHLNYATPATIPVKPPAPTSPPGVYFSTPGEISRLDAQTGKVIWRTKVPAKVVAINKGQSAGKPVILGNTVYLVEVSAVVAFDASKGTLRWVSFFDTGVGDISLINGQLYLYPFLPSIIKSNNKLYVVNPADGKIKATYDKAPQGGWDAPIVDGVQYYLGEAKSGGPALYALQLSSQKQLWHQQFPADQAPDNVTVKNGIVYVSSMILASNKRKDSAGLLYAFDATTGKQLWKSPELPTGVRTFQVSDDNIVYCASIGDFDAFDGHTGKHLWHQHADVSDMLLNAGLLYINDSTNVHKAAIAVLQARDGKVIWRIATGAGNQYRPFLGLQRGILYMIAGNDKVRSIDALRASDGTRIWHLSINGNADQVLATVA